jgi:hypothetical protein
MIEKIVSGGQTGTDRAGLDVAIRRGLPHGGWCPKGRKAEDPYRVGASVKKPEGGGGKCECRNQAAYLALSFTASNVKAFVVNMLFLLLLKQKRCKRGLLG